MASSPSVQRCLLSEGKSDDFNCVKSISIDDISKEFDNEMKVSSSYQLNRGHILLQKQVEKHIMFHSDKVIGKRRLTFSGHEHKLLWKKRRRCSSVALPTKFLLGGDITDPLNLRSFEDAEINRQLTALTPVSSPMPMAQRSQVQVCIPHNIFDPLNLNSGAEIEFNLMTSRPRKRKRHRKIRHEENETIIESYKASNLNEEIPCIFLKSGNTLHDTQEGILAQELMLDLTSCINNSEEKSDSQIVSPVVPQGTVAKLYKRFHSRSISKEDEIISLPKQVPKYNLLKTRQEQKLDYVKFQANVEKFCYGNHIANQFNWNYANDDYDERLSFLSRSMFEGKDVLDIGCNTGKLTLYVARYFQPKRIVGLDIDKKLVNLAQRTVLRYVSEDISRFEDFPACMSALYGPLTRIGKVFPYCSAEFMTNVHFFEANYVPPSEDYLETQKPEFDTILCLRATKWIHLNFGDNGLKLAFKRMYSQLRMGGHLILEPHPWFTYSKSKRITPAMYNTYCSLQMRPESFCEYLLSEEVGFSSCELIGRSFNYSKVYHQPVYCLTKGFETSCIAQMEMDVLSNEFHCSQWIRNSGEIQHF